MIWALSRSARDTLCLMGQGLTAHFTMLCTTYCSTDLSSALSSHCLFLSLVCSGLERGVVEELKGSCLGVWSKSAGFSELKMWVKDLRAPIRRYETLTALSSNAKASNLEHWSVWEGCVGQVDSWWSKVFLGSLVEDDDENESVSGLFFFPSSSLERCISISCMFSCEHFILWSWWVASHPCSSNKPIK